MTRAPTPKPSSWINSTPGPPGYGTATQLARRIPGCWAQHPEIVEEPTALWLDWQGACHQPDATLTAAVDWHDRWLSGLLHRLEHGPFALDCSEAHTARSEASYADAMVPWTMSRGAERSANAETGTQPTAVPRTKPLVGTPVPAVTITLATSAGWFTDVPRTNRTPSAMPFIPCR